MICAPPYLFLTFGTESAVISPTTTQTFTKLGGHLRVAAAKLATR